MQQLIYIKESTTLAKLFEGSSEVGLNQICLANSVSMNAPLHPNSFVTASDSDLSINIKSILNGLKHEEKRCTNAVIEECGQESLALALFFEKYFSNENVAELNTFIGASVTASTARLDNFEKTLVNYQNSLLELKKLSDARKQGRTDFLAINRTKQQVKAHYQALQNAYTVELNRLSPIGHRHKNRGNALSNAERGITIATGKKNQTHKLLVVTDPFQASSLANLGKTLNGVGHLTVGLDVVNRLDKVMTVEEAGGDWMRESAKQVTGFGSGAAAGGAVGLAIVEGGTFLAAKTGLAMAVVV